MRIEWNIQKKRGNLRPVLTYSVSLEDHEKALAMHSVSVVSSIPVPEEARQEYCYPDQWERSDKGETRECYRMEAPSHKGHSWTHALRLPWREENEYPEVEESFLRLREAFEQELARAFRSRPLQMQGSLCLSDEAKAGVAPAVLADRFLQIAQKRVGHTG